MRDKRSLKKHKEPLVTGKKADSADRGSPIAMVAVFLAVLTLAAHLPGLKNGFVQYDDREYVTTNERVQRGLTAQNVKWAFATTTAYNWHPLTWLSHMLDCQIFGLKAWGHHLTSLVLHVASTTLLFLLLVRVRRRDAAGYSLWFPAAVVAGLFGVHPLHVESVAWVAERKDVLSTLFWLLTMWSYSGYVLGRRKTAPYILALAFFALGLMSKPMLVTLPFVLLLWDAWPLKRTDRRRLVVEKVPFLMLAVASGVITLLAQQQGGAVTGLGRLTLGARVGNALVSYIMYLKQTLVPAGLAVFYPHPGNSLPLRRVVASVIVLASITAAVAWQRRRRPYLPVGWLWYLGTLLPVIGLIQVGMQARADRYAYVPLIGIFMMAAFAADEVAGRTPAARRVATVSAAALLVILAGLTVRQTTFWKDTTALFTRDAAVVEDNHFAIENLAITFLEEKRWDEAIAYSQKALESDPLSAPAHSTLGLAYQNVGRLEDAIRHHRLAVRSKPNWALMHSNLGAALMQNNEPAEAASCFRKALELNPGDRSAALNLALALAEADRPEEAVAQYEKTIQQWPDSPDAHFGLGVLLARQNQASGAARHYETALRLDPRRADVAMNLGILVAEQKDFGRAEALYEQAAAVQPGNTLIYLNWGNALSEQNRLDEALERYRTALKHNPENADVYRMIGATYERLGKQAEAHAAYEKALAIHPDMTDRH
jgi:tetratricopeptide (TPR) repeat protein